MSKRMTNFRPQKNWVLIENTSQDLKSTKTPICRLDLPSPHCGGTGGGFRNPLMCNLPPQDSVSKTEFPVMILEGRSQILFWDHRAGWAGAGLHRLLHGPIWHAGLLGASYLPAVSPCGQLGLPQNLVVSGIVTLFTLLLACPTASIPRSSSGTS